MQTQLTKIIKYAESQTGSGSWHGYCQAFVSTCYQMGTGIYTRCKDANTAKKYYMKSGTANDLQPPKGAAVYFVGDGEMGKKYGHTALSAGGGIIYDPVNIVVKARLNSKMHNGYLGWGWLGGMPEGAKETKSVSSSSSKSTAAEKEPIYDITKVKVVAEKGSFSAKNEGLHDFKYQNGKINILIQNGDKVYSPVVVNDVTVTNTWRTSAGILKFTVLDDGTAEIINGSAVAFRYNNEPVFYGYIFEHERDLNNTINITCYDQLRYLKNKDSFVYNSSYSDLLLYIAKKYGMKTGVVENTGYVIPDRIEEDTLLDILETAASITNTQTGGMYVLYDDFGKLTLKSIGNMNSGVYIDNSAAGSFSIKKDIDFDVYNRVVIAYDNTSTGVRELYISNDSEKQAKWGVLQYYERADSEDTPEVIKKNADILLKKLNIENSNVSVKQCVGNIKVRGGSGVYVKLGDNSKVVYMICAMAEHVFSANSYFMNLELSGGFHIDGK